MTSAWMFAAVFAASLALTPAGLAAAENKLLLEVVVNGRPTGQVGEFVDIDGALFATPTELNELGIAVPDSLAAKPGLVPLSDIPGLGLELNRAEQRVLFNARDSALRPTTIGTPTLAAAGPLTPTANGAVLNYDLLGTQTGRITTGAAIIDQRVFGPWGVVSTGALASAAGRTFTRLDTSYTYYDPDELRAVRVGDLVTGALTWTRPVRIAGVQLSSDFSLRPGLVSYPLPLITASAAIPSTVDVLVNGIRQYSQAVQPGPFQVRSLPLLTGAGEVGISVLDALGRQSVVTLPFYAAPELLIPGLASYSVEAGAIRRSFGLPGDGYRGWAASGSVRYGLTDWITPEAHAEGNEDLQLAGVGAAVRIGSLGVVSLAGSASTTAASRAASTYRRPVRGGQGFLGVSRRTGTLSVSVSAVAATAGYRDVASIGANTPPRLSFNANVARSFGRFGAAGIAYIRQQGGSLFASGAGLGTDLSRLTVVGSSVELLTASYSVQLTDRVGLFATGFRDLRSRNTGASFGLTLFLGDNVSTSAALTVDGGRIGASLQASRPAIEQDDYGYNVVDQEGSTPNRRAQAEYLSRWGRVTAGVAQTGTAFGGQAGLRGSLVFADGHLFAGDQVYDSFAIVSSGDVAGVPVLFENRRIGKTSSGGALLVPYLNAYQTNTIALDPAALPADIQVDRVDQKVRPARRSGVILDFGIRRVQAAVLRLIGADGKPVQLGASAQVGGGPPAPVGYDGQAYLTGLAAQNTVSVTLGDGSTCQAIFAWEPVAGDIPLITAVCK